MKNRILLGIVLIGILGTSGCREKQEESINSNPFTGKAI